MSAVVNRPVRTAAQGSVAFALVEFVDAFFYDMSERQYGALVAMLVIVFSWLQVLLENQFNVGVLRDDNE